MNSTVSPTATPAQATFCLVPGKSASGQTVPLAETPTSAGPSPGLAPALAPSTWAGQRLGEYEIGNLLGAGGNGQVFAARHRWLDIPVAIKFLASFHGQDAATIERFRREGMTSAKLIHPGLVRTTDGGMAGSHCFLVTEYVDGQDLAALLRSRGQLSIGQACSIIGGACEALGFIASRNAVHRDIKPSNIMVDVEGRVRILDFGLARTAANGQTMTETGQVMGTFDFMAPEQAVDPRKVDFRADLYSLGCTFYYLLTGQAPFQTDQHESIGAKLLAHIEGSITPIANFRKDVPRTIVDLIDQMLSSDPLRRPASFAEVQKVALAAAPPADLAALVGGHVAVLEKPPVADRMEQACDRILQGLAYVGQYLLVCLGVLQTAPKTRSSSRTRFQFSYRWLKVLAAIFMLGLFLWAVGFRIYPMEEDPGYDSYGYVEYY